jgi:ABC-2 type transport system permease protein
MTAVGAAEALAPTPGRPAPALAALTRRALGTCWRMPSLVAGPVLMSAFFLVIYDGQLSPTAGAIVPGGSYISFLLPLVLLTTAFVGGAIAGQLLLRDLDSGYHACLALTPSRRGLLVLAPVLAGIAMIAIQSMALIALAYVLGLQSPHGLTGVATLLSLTVVVGTGFLLLAVAAALIGRTAAAVAIVTYIFFPLSFLTTTFAPREQLRGWMALAADLNPLTYLLAGMRDTLSPGWSAMALLQGSVAAGIILMLGLVAVWAGLAHDAKEVDR